MRIHASAAQLLSLVAVMAGAVPAAKASEAPLIPDRSAYGDPAEFEKRDLPVSAQDLQILGRADQLLGAESSWNRADDRECKDDEASGKRSLFCALQAASIEVLGHYEHRRAALQEVRFAIQQVTQGREFEHRLRDFNNLPQTTLSDVHKVLQMARDRVAVRLAAASTAPTPDASR